MPIGRRTCDLRRTDKNPEIFTHRKRLTIKRTISGSAVALFLSIRLTGAATVPVPESELTFQQRGLSPQEVSEVLKSAPRSADAKSAQYSAIPADGLILPKAGRRMPLGVVVSSDLEAAFRAYFHGRGEATLTRLAQNFGSNPGPLAELPAEGADPGHGTQIWEKQGTDFSFLRRLKFEQIIQLD